MLIVSLRADWLAWGSVFFRTKPSSGSLESNSRYAMTPAATSNPYTSRRYVSLILSANEDTVALVLEPDPLIAFSSASLCAWSAPKFQKAQNDEGHCGEEGKWYTQILSERRRISAKARPPAIAISKAPKTASQLPSIDPPS